MVFGGGQIVQIAHNQPLRTNKGIKAVIGAGGLIALQYTSIKQAAHVSGIGLERTGPSVRRDELQAMAEAFIQGATQGVVPGSARVLTGGRDAGLRSLE